MAKLNPAGTAYDYITYLGGPGVDVGYGIAVDSNHNAYITGKTIAGTFPTTPGAFQAQSPSTSQRLNAFVTKLSPTGSSLVYSTYLAGTSGGFTDVEDHGTAIAVDSQGRAAVTGVASSSNFPTTSNAFDTSFFGAGTYKAFVTLLKPDGSGLLYSTFLGGNNNDEDLGRGIAFDAQGNIHVAGETSNEDSRRNGPTGFPTTSGAYQSSAGVPLVPAAFYAEINPNLSGAASLVYSTVFYGSHPANSTTPDTTTAYAVAVDSSGRAYVVGSTLDATLPMRNGFDTTYGGDNSSGGQVSATAFWRFSTRVSRAMPHWSIARIWAEQARDVAYAVASTGSGKVVVTGSTKSSDFPTTSDFGGLGATSSAFLTRIDTNSSGARVAPRKLSLRRPRPRFD